jgi:hypothetical protein
MLAEAPDSVCCMPLSAEQAPVHKKKLSIISGQKQILPAVMQYRYIIYPSEGVPKRFNDS